MRSGRAARGQRPATRHGSRGLRTGSTGSTCAGRARHGTEWIAFGEEVGESVLRGDRRRVVRPSRGRLRGHVAGDAARDGRAGGADRRRRGGASLAAGLLRRRGVRGPRARERPAHGAPLGRRGRPAGGRPRWHVRGGRSTTWPGRRLAPPRRRARRRATCGGGPFRVRLRAVAAGAVPRGRGRSHRGHQAGRRVRGAARRRQPLRRPHCRAGSTTTPRTTACPRSTGGASRSHRTATASRSIPRRAIGSSIPTRSASPAATWRAASRTSPTGRSSRPARCQYETTPDTNFVIDRHPAFDNVWLAGGGSGHGFKHGPVIGATSRACSTATSPRATSFGSGSTAPAPRPPPVRAPGAGSTKGPPDGPPCVRSRRTSRGMKGDARH